MAAGIKGVTPEETAAVYTRISTDEDLQKWSLGAQEKELLELAGRRGYGIYRTYRDTITGSRSSRPGLDRLRDDMSAGKFKLILVVDQDRLSRMEPIDWELLKREIRQAGARIVTPFQEIDFSDEDNELVSDVFNLFARHQRRKIKKAMQRGRAEAAENGIWLGKLPYGRKKVSEPDGRVRIIADPEKGPTVRKIFSMYAGGMGIHSITREMNGQGIPSPGGGEWDSSTVHRILTQPMHRGDLRRRENGREIYLKGIFEPTVPAELYDLCQQTLKNRREGRAWSRTGQVTALAAGILHCQCGKKLNVHPISVKRGSRSYVYYHYRHRERRNSKVLKPACPASYRVPGVDREILKAAQKVLLEKGPGWLLVYVGERNKSQKELTARLEMLKKAHARLKAKKEKLLRLYLEDGWDRAELESQKRIVDAGLKQNREEWREVKGMLDGMEEKWDDGRYMEEYYCFILNIEREMSRLMQQKLIRLLFPRVEVDLRGNLRIVSLLAGGGGRREKLLPPCTPGNCT